MNVKGFILEDDQKREFVLMCEQQFGRLGRTFLLRGWQRRRLVPLQYAEWELPKIAGEVLATLDDLFRSPPILLEHIHGVSSDHAGSATPLTRKTPVLKKAPGVKGIR